ncbi:18425_t:CDS:1, partial [Racocetra persica]
KTPILYMIETQRMLVVWEANCALKDVRIRWYENRPSDGISVLLGTSNILVPLKLDDYHHVYKAIIGPFESISNYEYEIIHKENERKPEAIIASNSFQFFPVLPNDSNSSAYPIKIVAFSDNQFGLTVFNRLVKSAFQHHTPNFIIHAGDAVQDYKNLQQWQTDFYDPLSNYQLSQQAPMIYAHGNHDYDKQSIYAYTTDMPWYSFTIANTRWIVLDSNIDDIKQDEWLVQELSSSETKNAEFRIVVVHIPPFVEFWEPGAWHDKNEKQWGEFVRTRFVPLFRTHGVDLVISGHQHNYQRGQLDGIVYAIIGGSGGELDLENVEDWKMYVTTKKTHHYVLMEIWSDKIIWVVYDLEGFVIDKFELGNGVIFSSFS